MKRVQNIIIGFGKGGKTLAKFLAQKGEEVLVIEKSNQMYGGDVHQYCLLAIQTVNYRSGQRC